MRCAPSRSWPAPWRPREGAESLLHPHLNELTTTSHQIIELLSQRLFHRARRGADRPPKAAQYVRIDAIGLGQLPAGLGEIAHLARVDYRQTQPPRRSSPAARVSSPPV